MRAHSVQVCWADDDRYTLYELDTGARLMLPRILQRLFEPNMALEKG